MNAVVEHKVNGIYPDISNAHYHASEGISKSGLDMIRKSPASYMWQFNAPVDENKTKALDFGTAVHCLLLEPTEFSKRYVVAPSFNMRTNQGKADAAEFAEKATGLTVISAEDDRKMNLMAKSVFAHPTAGNLILMKGLSEQSVFWTDKDTGALCRCRPDKLIDEHKIIVDVKTIADMSRLQRHVEEYRYFVQDSFYRAGLKAVTGDDYDFLFIFISTSINCGRYPVDVVRLTDAARFDGEQHYKEDLQKYMDCKKYSDWQSITEIDRPYWATQQEGDLL